MGKDVRQASFRLNSEDTERFKSFCDESEMTAAQGFAVLMEIMELDRAGKMLPTRKTEIENFEQLTKSMVSAYLHSLELNENAENRIREQFAAQLESRARTIADYQEQISTLNSQLEGAVELAESYRADLHVAQDSFSESERMSLQYKADLSALKEERDKQLSDKENIISMLTEKLMAAEQKGKGFNDIAAQNSVLKASLAAAQQTIKDNKKDAEIALERAVRERERTIEVKKSEELERLRSQNMELLQTIASDERSSNEQIRALDMVNADLRETVAHLKAQLKLKNINKNGKKK